MPSKLPPEELRRLNSMEFFIAETKKYNIKPKVIFDIGSYNAAHLQELGLTFDVGQDNLYAFEAHPGMIQHCRKRVKNVWEGAISNTNGYTKFNAIDLTQNCHHGCSSLYKIGRPHNAIDVRLNSIDSIIGLFKWCTIPDMVKIDVEGMSYEVLEGFGKYLKRVKILHVECETKDCYGGQKTEKDILEFMDKAGFVSVHRLFIPEFQCDHIFVRKDLTI